MLFSLLIGCTGDLYHFRFHISEIAPRELIKKATLRFHVEKNTSSTSSYITLFYSDSHTEKFLSTDQSSQWIEFEVGQYIMEWNRNTSSNRPTHIDFQIISNIGMNRVACDDQRLQLTINSDNQDLHPLLVVYSYDPNQELSDFVNTIERAAEEGIQDEDRTRRSTDPATVVTPTTQTNHCQKIDEAMDKVTFNKFLNPFGMELIGPASIPFHYCGGTCENTLSTTPTHASILSLHISEEDSEEKEKYCKYCVPIKYSDLHIIIKKISLTEILILKNSLVEDCGCIYSYSL